MTTPIPTPTPTQTLTSEAVKSHTNVALIAFSFVFLIITLIANNVASSSSDFMVHLASATVRLGSVKTPVYAGAAIAQADTQINAALERSSVFISTQGIVAARESARVILAKNDLLPAAQKELKQAIGQSRAALNNIKVSAEVARDDERAPAWVKTQAIQVIDAVGRVAAFEQSPGLEPQAMEKELELISKAQSSSRSDLSRDIEVIKRLVGRSLDRVKSIVPSEEDNNAVLTSLAALIAAIGKVTAQASSTKLAAQWIANGSSIGLFFVAMYLGLKKSIQPAPGASRIAGYSNREAITRLTDDIRRVAGGDLSRDVSTSEPSTQVIAEELNNAIESWRLTIGQVSRNAASVEARVASTQEHAELSRQRSERQERETNNALSGVKKVASLTIGITQDSLASEYAATTALEAVYSGSRAVQSSVEKMKLIREGIQQNEMRIKRLGERSREIDAVTDILSSVFEQINVLAVNASVEGTRAGEVGRRFLVVAREIKLLSDQTEKALGKISNLVKTIQAETSQASELMEVSTRNAREGESIVQMAGASLEVIEVLTKGLAGMVEHISEATKEQSEQAAAVSLSMENVLSLAQEVSESATTVTTNVDDIGQSMRQLNESVREFKVGKAKAAA